MEEYGVDQEPMGSTWGTDAYRAVRNRGVDVETSAATDIMLDARKTKTRDEIECLRQVAAICEAGFQKITETARPGEKESEVWGHASKELWRHGAMVQGGYVTSGPNTWPKHQANTTDRQIRPGDIVYADFYNIGYLGYRSCYYRTFSMGEPTRHRKTPTKQLVTTSMTSSNGSSRGHDRRDMQGLPRQRRRAYRLVRRRRVLADDDQPLGPWAGSAALRNPAHLAWTLAGPSRSRSRRV